MKEVFYWPPRESQFSAWLANFIKFVKIYKDVIGLTEEDLAWLNALYAAVSFAEQEAANSKKLWLDFLAIRNVIINGDPNVALGKVPWPEPSTIKVYPEQVAPNAMIKLAEYVQRVTKCLSFTRDQLVEAGVTSKVRTKPNPSDGKPVLKVTVVNGQAVLDCPLKGFKGYAVFAKDGDAEVVHIGNSTARRYVDTRPLPANMTTQQRTYFVQYIWNDNELVGEYSNSVTVAVMRFL